MEKCFCHFGGYKVKDADARSALADMQKQLITVITPQKYGAAGDGVTDDTDAILAAVEAAETGCGRLYFPKGTYIINKPIVISNGTMIDGVSPRNSVIVAGKDFEGDAMIYFKNIEMGGGAQNIDVNGHNRGVNGIRLENDEGFDVGAGFIVRFVNISNCVNGLDYVNGWQVTIHDVYVSSCSGIGINITAADSTIHDCNITNCTTGLRVDAGTIKISNIKIDNCLTRADTYACYMRNTRGSVSNLEVQYCQPNGLYLEGDHMFMRGIMVDSIGRLVDPDTYAENDDQTGHAIAVYEVHNSDIEIAVRNYGQTKMLVEKQPSGNVSESLNNIYVRLHDSNFTIFTEKESVFTYRRSNSKGGWTGDDRFVSLRYELSNNLQLLQDIGCLTMGDTYASFRITEETVPNIGEYVAGYVEVDMKTAGTVSNSIYESGASVVKESIGFSNDGTRQYFVLQPGTTNFTIRLASTAGVTLRNAKVVLYKEIYKCPELAN